MYEKQRELLKRMIADGKSIDLIFENAKNHNRMLTLDELESIKLIALRIVLGTSFLE